MTGAMRRGVIAVISSLLIAGCGGSDNDEEDVPSITIVGISIASTPDYDSACGRSEAIMVEVRFSGEVTVSGVPSIALTIGEQTRQATYESGSGTRALVFGYVVEAADSNTQGITVAANTISLNGGGITGANGGSVSLRSTNLSATSIDRVDGGAEEVVDVSPITVGGISIVSTPEDGSTYGRSEKIVVEARFSGEVTVSGVPSIALTIGEQTRQATYESGSGSRVLRFSYIVSATDESATGITIVADAISANDGGILGAYGADNVLLGHDDHTITNAPGHNVDGDIYRPPTPVSLRLVGRPLRTSTYGATESIEIEVEFGEVVTVRGRPSLELTIGGQARQAFYEGGSGTETLTFGYVVEGTDRDADGITVAANTLSLNGGSVSDADGNGPEPIPDSLIDAALAEAGNPNVDGSVDHPPVVAGVRIGSSPLRGDVYGATELIEVDVVFSESVVVKGNPTLTLAIGPIIRPIPYKTAYDGSGRQPEDPYLQVRPGLYRKNSQSLTFLYFVDASDQAPDGIGIAENALSLAGGRIFDAGGNDADLSLDTHAIDAAAEHKVDGSIDRTPFVKEVAIVSSPLRGDTYGPYENIEVEVVFSEPVLIRNSNGDTTAFLRDGNYDVTGVIPPSTSVGHPSIAITLDPSEEPWMLEAVYYEHEIGGSDSYPHLLYRFTLHGSESFFRFRGLPDMSGVDLDGISILADAFVLNGGTIQDLGGNDAELDLSGHAIMNAADHKVNTESSSIYVKPDRFIEGGLGVACNIENYGSEYGSTYRAGDDLFISIILPEPLFSNVTVSGEPTLSIQIGSEVRQAEYQGNITSGGGLFFGLGFKHIIESDDFAPNGVQYLGIDGGTILDQHGRTVHIVLDDRPANARVFGGSEPIHVRNAIFWAPNPTNRISIEQNPYFFGGIGDYTYGESITIAIQISEPVTVEGIPLLELAVGSKIRFAEYRVNQDYSEFGLGDGTFLFFAYDVKPSDFQLDALVISHNPLVMNGGSIKTINGDAIDQPLSLSIWDAYSETILAYGGFLLKEDGGESSGPYFAGVNGGMARDTVLSWTGVVPRPPADRTLYLGEVVYLWIYFTQEVGYADASYAEITIGSKVRQAAFHGVDPASQGRGLLFKYTIGAADFGRIRIPDNPVHGTITDSSGVPLQGDITRIGFDDAVNFADGSEDGNGNNMPANLSDGGNNMNANLPTNNNGPEITESILQQIYGYSCEITTGSNSPNMPRAVISDIPDSGTAPFTVSLDGSGSSGGDGAEITLYDWILNGYFPLPNEPGPIDLVLAPGRNRIQLEVTDANGNTGCAEKVVTVEIGDGSAYGVDVYDDKVITMDITDITSLIEGEGEETLGIYFLAHLTNVLYTYFEDDFDFILLFSNNYRHEVDVGYAYEAQYYSVQNAIGGLGPSSGAFVGRFNLTAGYGSGSRLQGISYFISTQLLREYGNHEIMHRWGNFMIPVADYGGWRGHWGLSSVYGQLGGFDLRYLERAPKYDDIDGAPAYEIVDGGFAPFTARVRGSAEPYVDVYGPLELYLMGLIPLDEVPTIWAATERLPVAKNQLEEYEFIHIVPQWEAYDHDRILREFGPRNPPYGQAQTEFKAAAVVMVTDEKPANEEQLQVMAGQVRDFSFPGDEGDDLRANFWEATGGRATIEMDRLSFSRKAVPTPPTVTLPSASSHKRMRNIQGIGGPIH